MDYLEIQWFLTVLVACAYVQFSIFPLALHVGESLLLSSQFLFRILPRALPCFVPAVMTRLPVPSLTTKQPE